MWQYVTELDNFSDIDMNYCNHYHVTSEVHNVNVHWHIK